MGTTYSPRQSQYLEQDWKKTYLEVLDAGFDVIRLGAYWSEMEKEPDVFDFDDLDWQIAMARKKGIQVLLTVGMKAPRWPEYFIPEWVFGKRLPPKGADLGKETYLCGRTLIFIRKVVERYKNEKSIRYWQVENEPLDRMGAHKWWIGKSFLKREVELVRELDPENRPIVINVATYPNLLHRLWTRLFTSNDPIGESIELCDILGLNVYPVFGHKFLGYGYRVRSSKRARLEYLKKVVALAEKNGREVWATELQAEPWEPGQLVHKGKEQPSTSSPEEFRETLLELRSVGIDTVFLWGAEYWYFRKIRHNDHLWWDTAVGLARE